MYYLRARYYDPVIARFITKDSLEGDISNPLSINQYIYCFNNPLIYIDPSGHYTQLDFSNWTGTAAQAAQLQALYANYEAYNAGHIDASTASSNYTSIMNDYASNTINGNRNNDEAIATQPSPKSNNNPDVSPAVKQITAKEEAKKAEQKATQSEYKDGYSINSHYGLKDELERKERGNLSFYGQTSAIISGLASIASFIALATAPAWALPVGLIAVGATVYGMYNTYQKYEKGYINKSQMIQDIAVASPGVAFGAAGLFAKSLITVKSTLQAIGTAGAILSAEYSLPSTTYGLYP